MAEWGSYSTPYVPNAPEFYYYAQGTFNTSGMMGLPAITPEVQNYLFSTDYSWYGVNNLYNMMMLIQDCIMYAS